MRTARSSAGRSRCTSSSMSGGEGMVFEEAVAGIATRGGRAMTNDHIFLSLPGLAESWKPFLRKLLNEDLLPVSVLGKLVDAYHRVIREEAGRGGSVNLAIGESISKALRAFLPRVD